MLINVIPDELLSMTNLLVEIIDVLLDILFEQGRVDACRKPVAFLLDISKSPSRRRTKACNSLISGAKGAHPGG
jgi:hypothetical protein